MVFEGGCICKYFWCEEMLMWKSILADNGVPPDGSFNIPHSITTLEDQGWVCVADRENGRIQCFDYDGKFIKNIHMEGVHSKIYAVSYGKKDSKFWFYFFKWTITIDILAKDIHSSSKIVVHKGLLKICIYSKVKLNDFEYFHLNLFWNFSWLSEKKRPVRDGWCFTENPKGLF